MKDTDERQQALCSAIERTRLALAAVNLSKRVKKLELKGLREQSKELLAEIEALQAEETRVSSELTQLNLLTADLELGESEEEDETEETRDV
jgi:hypothetical protein